MRPMRTMRATVSHKWRGRGDRTRTMRRWQSTRSYERGDPSRQRRRDRYELRIEATMAIDAKEAIGSKAIEAVEAIDAIDAVIQSRQRRRPRHLH